MSYELRAFAVDVDQLSSLVGSGNKALFNTVIDDFTPQLDHFDDVFFDEIDRGDPTVQTALRHILIDGVIPPRSPGYPYGYALELLCHHVGWQLTGPFGGIDIAWLEEVDRALDRAGAPPGYRALVLVSGRLPLPIPRPSDFPGIGMFDTALIRQARDWRAVSPPPTSGDGRLDRAARCLLDWAASVEPNESIVGFYS